MHVCLKDQHTLTWLNWGFESFLKGFSCGHFAVVTKYQNGYHWPKYHSINNKLKATLLLTCLLNKITYCGKVKLKFWVVFLKKKGIFMCPLWMLAEHINCYPLPKYYSVSTKYKITSSLTCHLNGITYFTGLNWGLVFFLKKGFFHMSLRKGLLNM